MVKLWTVAVIFVVGAVMSLTEAQDIPSCATKLVPCADYLNSTTTPPASCCDPIKQTVANDLTCLCNLYKDPNFLKAFNINITDALRLTRNCGVSTDLSVCSKSQSPTASTVPPPGQAGNDGGATDRIAWTAITSLLLFLATAILY
ncbi:hypothetical protein SLE2022_089220 [Rubroshorea leprosula]